MIHAGVVIFRVGPNELCKNCTRGMELVGLFRVGPNEVCKNCTSFRIGLFRVGPNEVCKNCTRGMELVGTAFTIFSVES